MIERANGYMAKLLKKATYAINSNSRDLVYQTYGSACTAYELNTMLVYNFLNRKGGATNDIHS